MSINFIAHLCYNNRLCRLQWHQPRDVKFVGNTVYSSAKDCSQCDAHPIDVSIPFFTILDQHIDQCIGMSYNDALTRILVSMQRDYPEHTIITHVGYDFTNNVTITLPRNDFESVALVAIAKNQSLVFTPMDSRNFIQFS